MHASGIASPRQTRRFRNGRLCDIKLRQQRFAAALSRDAHGGAECVLVGIPNTVAGATIAVPEQDTSFFIHRDFVKVEQVAVLDPAAATLPNAAFALDRVVRREVGHTPAITT